MGNGLSWDRLYGEQKLQSLMFLQEGEDQNEMVRLGKFKIYRSSVDSRDLFLKHSRVFTADNNRSKTYCDQVVRVAESVWHKNLARIHSIGICSQVNLCGKQIVVECYADCYKLTLEQVIESRKKNDVRFTTGELWYLISSLVDLSIVLADHSLLFGIYLSKNLFLSSEGYLKLYLFHLLAQDNYILYYHALASDSRNLYKFLPLAPQCLLPLASSAKLQCDESLFDVFGIGMLALEAMLFGSTRKYYLSQSSNQKKLSFNEEQLKKDIKELKGIYPHNLMLLIENMVQIEPKKRWSFTLARNYIKKVREEISIGGAIKLFQDEQNPIAPKLSYQSVETESVDYSVCEKIQSKLECQPLREIKQEKYWSCGNSAYKESCFRKGHKSNNMGVSLTGRKQSSKLITSSLVKGNGLR